MRLQTLTILGGLLALLPVLAVPAAAGNAAAEHGVQRMERGALVLENVPPVPDELAATLFQYQQARAASFAGWLPAPHGMLITTRFGQTRQVHRVADPLGDRQQLTFFPEAVSNIVTVSDPEQPGFLFGKDSGGDEHYQIYYQDLASGRQSRLTHGGARNTAPRWSNMGDYFAYSTTQRNGRDTDIHVYERATGESRPVLQSEGLWYTLDWSPDDRKLLVLRYVSVGESYPHILDLETGELAPFRPSIYPVSFGTARFSRDGRGVFYTSDEDSEFRQLRFHDLRSGDSRLLTGEIPWDVTSFALSRDGRYLAFVTNADGRSELHLRAVREWRPVAVPDLPMGVVRGLRFSEDGWRIGFTLNSPRTPGDVYSFRVGETQLTRWTKSEVGGLSTDQFVVPELVRYPTFDFADGSRPAEAPGEVAAGPAGDPEGSDAESDPADPKQDSNPDSGEAPPPRRTIPAFVYRPAGPGPHPVLVLMHGGPASQARPTFNPVLQYWVNELGLAVIAPNVRGSTGYGREFKMLDDGRLREDSVRDVGALLDWIDTQPELDGARVGIIGGSYGGYMVMASMIHYGPRLRAGVNVVGISNFVTFLENTGVYRRDRRRLEYGDERDPEMRAYLKSISPTTHADRIVQPLFIAQGANDPRVPQSEADQMVATIRSHGGEVWYFLARDEGHGFRKKVNRDYYNNAVALFLRTHLLDTSPAPGELPAEAPRLEAQDGPAAPVEVPDEDAADEVDDAMHAPLEPPTQDSPEEPLDPVTEPPNGQSTLAQVLQFR
ncbi:MAG TPA: prolyl oligopeptidase family serine peptidase [Gammaproteobacteria bacterium]|nr:prolyl oligopeptidase family serine peptidase [Gammaproteobacteria bacterium]